MVAVSFRILIVLAILSVCVASWATVREDLSFITETVKVRPEKEKTTARTGTRPFNEWNVPFTSLIKSYQILLSSQDMPACNFTKGCSRFSYESFQKYGPLHGLMMTSDRLQRCNAFARKYYPIHPINGRAIDYPVEKYHLR
ncbi:MAG: membrane protein insertion efficiency factor YidD [bacterium]